MFCHIVCYFLPNFQIFILYNQARVERWRLSPYAAHRNVKVRRECWKSAKYLKSYIPAWSILICYEYNMVSENDLYSFTSQSSLKSKYRFIIIFKMPNANLKYFAYILLSDFKIKIINNQRSEIIWIEKCASRMVHNWTVSSSLFIFPRK